MCPAPFEKIFLFSEYANQLYISRRPVSLRGAARDVTDAGRDAVDAAARLTGVACSGRRRCVVLMPRRWHQVGGLIRVTTVARKPITGESAGISRKPLRAGMSGDFRWLAVNTRVHTYYPMRTRGFCNGRGLVNPFLLYPLAGHLLLFGIGAGPSPDGVHKRNRSANLRKA